MKKRSGFTLIELMVVLAIAAILVTLAAPSFVRLIQSSQVTGAVNTFLADVRFARSEAIRLGGSVTMCFRSTTDNSTGAVCGSDATVGWANGWVIFRDVNANGVRNYDVDASLNDTILRVQDPISAIGTIPDKSGNVNKFEFTATGRINSAGIATLTFGGIYPIDVQREVCVSRGGRAHVGNAIDPCP